MSRNDLAHLTMEQGDLEAAERQLGVAMAIAAPRTCWSAPAATRTRTCWR